MGGWPGRLPVRCRGGRTSRLFAPQITSVLGKSQKQFSVAACCI